GRPRRPRDAATLPGGRKAAATRVRSLPPGLMEFQDVVRKRKMVRSFEDRPIPRDIVDRILANAQRAPSAGFSQGWAFLAFDGPEQTARYWDALWPPERRARFGWDDMFKAPVLVVCLSNKSQCVARSAEPDKHWTARDDETRP